VITDRYKLGVWQNPLNPKASDYRSFGDMMFDLKSDPFELTNLAGTADTAAIEAGLREAVHQWEQAIPRALEVDSPSGYYEGV